MNICKRFHLYLSLYGRIHLEPALRKDTTHNEYNKIHGTRCKSGREPTGFGLWQMYGSSTQVLEVLMILQNDKVKPKP